MKLGKTILKLLGIYADIRMLDTEVEELKAFAYEDGEVDREELKARADLIKVIWERIT